MVMILTHAVAAAAAAVTLLAGSVGASGRVSGCRFAPDFRCEDFSEEAAREEYLSLVMRWEGAFARAGVGYDALTGYTYDGQFLDYATGDLAGEPHLFSAPSKESIHVSLLALAVSGNTHALEFVGGREEALRVVALKLDGYAAFNKTYPAYGCFTPWVSFSPVNGTLEPAWDWADPYRVPALDNGEWFWALYALAGALEQAGEVVLAERVGAVVECQKSSAKSMFYRGQGDVSAVISIIDPFLAPLNTSNYVHNEGWLNDPYEGELTTQMLYLFADWPEPAERDLLWVKKRGLFEAATYTTEGSEGVNVTVQKGWWFSTHEQWKLLLMPYLSDDLDIVKRVFRNAEVARSWDASAHALPGFFASVNDVTNGTQEIPSYISATGVQTVAFEEVLRRDVVTPYAGYSMMLFDLPAGLCWYNNLLQGPRMQGPFGSTESCAIDGSDICPLVTWDSKITTVLAMLGGVGDIVKSAMKVDVTSTGGGLVSAYKDFVDVVLREHDRVFGSGPLAGEEVEILRPGPANAVPRGQDDWKLAC